MLASPAEWPAAFLVRACLARSESSTLNGSPLARRKRAHLIFVPDRMPVRPSTLLADWTAAQVSVSAGSRGEFLLNHGLPGMRSCYNQK